LHYFSIVEAEMCLKHSAEWITDELWDHRNHNCLFVHHTLHSVWHRNTNQQVLQSVLLFTHS